MIFMNLSRPASSLVRKGYAESLVILKKKKTPGNTRENNLNPLGTQDKVGMSQSFSLERCQGMLPVKLCSQVRILFTSVRKCTHHMPDCHLDV